MEKVVFREGITSTIDTVRGRLTPRALERLKAEAGFDENERKPSYPLAALDATIKVLAEEFFRAPTLEQSTFELGRAAMKRYGESTLGGAMFSLVRMLGPMRFLKRMPATFRQMNNYAEATLEVTGPTRYELDHNEVGAYPHYMRGIFQGAGELMGLKGHVSELLSYDGHRARYRVHWQP